MQSFSQKKTAFLAGISFYFWPYFWPYLVRADNYLNSEVSNQLKDSLLNFITVFKDFKNSEHVFNLVIWREKG